MIPNNLDSLDKRRTPKLNLTRCHKSPANEKWTPNQFFIIIIRDLNPIARSKTFKTRLSSITIQSNRTIRKTNLINTNPANLSRNLRISLLKLVVILQLLVVHIPHAPHASAAAAIPRQRLLRRRNDGGWLFRRLLLLLCAFTDARIGLPLRGILGARFVGHRGVICGGVLSCDWEGFCGLIESEIAPIGGYATEGEID